MGTEIDANPPILGWNDIAMSVKIWLRLSWSHNRSVVSTGGNRIGKEPWGAYGRGAVLSHCLRGNPEP